MSLQGQSYSSSQFSVCSSLLDNVQQQQQQQQQQQTNKQTNKINK
jgi:hypothetical protein